MPLCLTELMTTETPISFKSLQLSEPVLTALDDAGYETPSPIQAQTIPMLLEGRDVLGQAQTGTGKTAAFALPMLSNLTLKQKPVQCIVLTPTRELAIQVAEAIQTYAKHLPNFHVLPVYGGQDYRGQIRALERGVHVVVGTPGRVMDHMRKGTLKLDSIKMLVLDEADEMLRMGFIDDVEWILERTPEKRQIALFSATMPTQIRRIASKFLNNPEHVTVKATTGTASTIRQRYWPVTGTNKLDALTRILEAEPFDAMLIFVRTKTSTVELADRLAARGYASTALNGDIAQNQRERTIEHLKQKKIDIVVATDVAARGLDVSRISHVINYDIPHDVESYIHRIGRTGRAGREGDAILFVAPRERRLHHAIEKATGKTIEPMVLPSNEEINQRRIKRFNQRITDTLENHELSFFEELIVEYQKEHDVTPTAIAAALAQQLQGDTPFLFVAKGKGRRSKNEQASMPTHSDRAPRHSSERNSSDKHSGDKHSAEKPTRAPRPRRSEEKFDEPAAYGVQSEKPRAREGRPIEKGMERFRLAVGFDNDVKPGNIVGAIANEAGIDSQYIGHIQIESDHSFIDLPEGMPKEIFNDLKKTRVCGVPIRMTRELSARSNDSKKPSGEKKSSGEHKSAREGSGKRAVGSSKPVGKRTSAKKRTATKKKSDKGGKKKRQKHTEA